MHGQPHIRFTVKLFVQWDPIVYIKTWNIMKFLVMIKIFTLNIFEVLYNIQVKYFNHN